VQIVTSYISSYNVVNVFPIAVMYYVIINRYTKFMVLNTQAMHDIIN